MRQRADAGLPKEEAADLARIEAGYLILCTYWPSLEAPVGATVCVLDGETVVDRLELPPGKAYDVWRHTAAYSERYAALLRPIPE